VAFLPEFLIIAELDARTSFCLGTTQAGTLQIVRAVLDVAAKLLFDVIRNLRRAKKPSSKGT